MNLDCILKDIDGALSEWQTLRSRSQYPDCSDQSEEAAAMVFSTLAGTIDRYAPPGSHHKKNLDRVTNANARVHGRLEPLAGALRSLRRDYQLGLVSSFAELVHAETFANFLEMADHLLGAGYKDPAAVLAGSVLEQHLRELCTKCQIPIESNGKFLKADFLNAELVKQNVYNKLDQKGVTSWLGLRNEAAHGNYTDYDALQVRLMIDAVQNFLSRYPA